jgi:hypothetical protein
MLVKATHSSLVGKKVLNFALIMYQFMRILEDNVGMGLRIKGGCSGMDSSERG